MTNKAQLANGVTVLHGEDCDGDVVFRYANGREVRTSWAQLAGIERLIGDLQDAYELLLARAHCPHSCAHLPVDILARIDETLYRTKAAVQKTGTLFRE